MERRGRGAPLIRFWPLQRLPVAWPCSGAASLRRPPAAALDGQSSGVWVSPLARASPPVRFFAGRKPDAESGVHPPNRGFMRLPERVMHRRVPRQRDVPLPAAREFSQPGYGRASRNGAPGVRPFAVLTRPARVGALPPVLPTCRFMADPLRRYRSKDRPPRKNLTSRMRRSIENHPSRLLGLVHAGQFAPAGAFAGWRARLPWALPLAGFRPPRWCAEAVSISASAAGPRMGLQSRSPRLKTTHRFRVLSAPGFAILAGTCRRFLRGGRACHDRPFSVLMRPAPEPIRAVREIAGGSAPCVRFGTVR
jgi:hypothetical protein